MHEHISFHIGIAVGPDGNLYVVDCYLSRVQVYTSFGQHVRQIGKPAKFGSTFQAAGYLRRPWGISISPEGLVYIADTGHDRVQVFSSTGSFVREVTGFESPIGIAVCENGMVYVSSGHKYNITAFPGF